SHTNQRFYLAQLHRKMTASGFETLPSGVSLDVKPFYAHVEEDKLQQFKKLLDLSPIAPAVFENTNAGTKFGLKRDWLQNAKEVWLNSFDWRKVEDRFNSFPNFKALVKDGDGHDIEIQFLALFSKKPDAVPLAFLHGWPGSICEFLDILDLLKSKYSPDDLPYHVIVPSLPGYGYSSGPPLDADYGIETAAGAIHNLMIGLGFGSGYIAQGGDLGSFFCRVLALKYDACKGIHVNQMPLPPLPQGGELPTDPLQKRALERGKEMVETGLAFLMEHGTRAATIGFVLSSSPLALLSWIGEKVLAWSDQDLPLDKILELVTIYWFTDTMPRCLYHNRDMGLPDEKPRIARTSVITGFVSPVVPYIEKPCGYSSFYNEIVPVPKDWAVKTTNLVFYNEHDRGGHFAAMEMPKELLSDVEEYIQKVWK
ncbi:unnamed protein product, partial [Clonostachys rosea]